MLYGGHRYACRHCHDLTYKSTRTAPGSEFYARANKVRARLGWGGGVASPMGGRKKGMHATTYLRLLNQLNHHGIGASADMDATNDRIQKMLNHISHGLGKSRQRRVVKKNGTKFNTASPAPFIAGQTRRPPCGDTRWRPDQSVKRELRHGYLTLYPTGDHQ